MIVAMAVVGMMQVPIDQVIDVIAMRDCFVTASISMDMARLVSTAVVVRGANVRILIGDRYEMLLDLAVGSLMMKMAVVYVIRVAVVLDGSMTAAWAVLMVMFIVSRAGHEWSPRFEIAGVIATALDLLYLDVGRTR